jgi:secreted trypsin-like serine protease
MKTSLKLLLSSALLLTLAACQGQDTSTLNLDGESIVGGSKVRSWSDLSKHVLAIYTGPSDDREICTAVLIRENVVLTAAHCVFQKNRIRIGTGVDRSGELLLVDKVIIHDQFNRSGTGVLTNDIALVRISEPLPRKYKPVPLPTAAEAPTPGMALTAVGYGRTGWLKNSDPSGRLRKVDIKVDRAGINKIWINQRDEKGICQGDSGGPSFLEKNGELYPVGITSHILMYTSDPEKKCIEESVLMDVVSYLPWINEQLQYF